MAFKWKEVMCKFIQAIEKVRKKTIFSLSIEVMLDDSGNIWLIDAYNLNQDETSIPQTKKLKYTVFKEICDGQKYCNLVIDKDTLMKYLITENENENDDILYN